MTGAGGPTVRRRLAVVLPFTSTPERRHASADTVEPAVARLARRHDVHLYVPGVAERAALPAVLADAPLDLLPSALPRSGAGALGRFGAAPWAVRSDWSAAAAREGRRRVAAVAPEVVLCEYVQTAEVLRGLAAPSVLTLHDRSAEVLRRAASQADGALRAYRAVEALRMARVERMAVARADRVLVLSAADRAGVAAPGRTGLLRFGIDPPAEGWAGGPPDGAPTVVLVGAWWRHANQAIARHCLDEVLPRVWAQLPQVRVRLVGDGPPLDLQARAAVDARISVTGQVDDLDRELRQASVVLAPALVGGGVLLKVLRPMALGVPVVTNALGAAGVAPPSGAARVAEGPGALAAATVELLRDPGRAAAVSMAARRHVAEHFGWDQALATYDAAFAAAIAARAGRPGRVRRPGRGLVVVPS